MRNSYKIVLVSILVIILACTLFACTGGKTPRPYEPAPNIPGTSEGNDGDIVSPDLVVGSPVYLSALIKEEYNSLSPSSNKKGNILPTLYADNDDLKDRVFKYEMIEIQVIGKFGKDLFKPLRFKLPNSDGTILEKTDLKEAWITQGSVNLSGKHRLDFSTTLLVEGKKDDFKEIMLDGSVEIYLGKYMNDIKKAVTFKFPEGYIPDFSQTNYDTTNDVYISQMMVGEKIAYADFVSNYRFKLKDQNAKDKNALSYWNVYVDEATTPIKFGNGDQYDKTLTIEANKSYKFVPELTNNITTVKFQITDSDFKLVSDEEVLVEKGVGIVPRPVIASSTGKEPNKELLGWYYTHVIGDVTETVLWNFNEPIGSNENLVLFPKFKPKTFSLTMYLRGAAFEFPESYTSTAKKSAQAYSSFQKYSPFGMNILKIDGLEAGGKYSDYKINTFISYETVEKNDNGVITVEKQYQSQEFDLSVFCDTKYNYMQKPGDANKFYNAPSLYIADNNAPWDVNSTIEKDLVINAEWPLKELDAEGLKEYDQYVFKNNVTLKADGTLRLDKIEDYYIESLRIPATYTVPIVEKAYNSLIAGKEYDVTEIGPLICQNFTGLTTLDLSSATNLTTIGDRAFANCTKLGVENKETKKGIIGADNTKLSVIGKEVFEDTKYLKEAKGNVVLNGILVKYINDKSDTNVEISGVETISASAFANNADIEEVNLIGVKKIYSGAFANCKKLKNVTITDVEYIAPDAFSNTPFFDDRNEILFDNNKYLYRVKTEGTNYAVRAEVETIGEDAFLNLTELKDIIFVDDASAINNVYKDAFKGTQFIISEKIYNNKTYILSGFVVINNILCAYTGNEISVSIPKGITQIAPYAFSGYNNDDVSDIMCPPSVRKIGAYAFADAFSKPYLDRGDARILFLQKGYKENPTAVEEKDIDIDPTAFATDYMDYENSVPVYYKGAMPSFLKFCYFTNVLNSGKFDIDNKSFINKLYKKDKSRFVSCKLTNLDFNDKIIQKDYLLYEPIDDEDIIDKIIKPNLRLDGKKSINSNEILDGIIETYILTNNDGTPIATDKGMKIKTGLMLNQELAVLEYVKDANNQDTITYTLGESNVFATKNIKIERTIVGAPAVDQDGVSIINANDPNAAIKIFVGENSPFFKDADGNYKIYEGKSFDDLKIEFKYSTEPDVQIIWPQEGKFPSTLIKGGNTTLDSYGNEKKLIIEYRINALLTYKIELDYMVVAKEFNKDIILNDEYDDNEKMFIKEEGPLYGELAIKLPINSLINDVNTNAFKMVRNDGSYVIPPTFNSAEFKIRSVEHYVDANGRNIIKDLQNPVLTELGSGTVDAVYSYKGKTLNVKFNFVVVMRPQYDRFEYEFDENNKTATIIGFREYHQGTMMVPGTVYRKDINPDGTSDILYTIVGIKVPNNKISSNKEVVEIGLPDSITEISANVFENWTRLNRIGAYNNNRRELFKEDFEIGSIDAENKFPKSLKTIGSEAFVNTALNEIVFAQGSKLENIEKGAFKNTLIKNLDLSECTNLNKISTQAFADCTELLNVILPANNGSLATQAFFNCHKLNNVSNVNSWNLNAGAFTNCRSLKAEIGEGRAQGYVNCYNDNLLNIEGNVLHGFNPEMGTSLDYLTISGGVNTIDENAFNGYVNLKYVYIPTGVTEIKANAFKDCTSLKTVIIPDTIISVDPTAFEGTAWFNSQNDGVVYAGKVAYTIKGAKESLTDVKIVAGTHTIAANLFKGYTGLTTLTIPASVKTIGANAFSGCEGITTVTLPVDAIDDITSRNALTTVTINGTETIPENAFAGLTTLTTLTILEGITGIGANAFNGCTKLTTITIPSSVKVIGENAFSGCTGLTTVTLPVNAIDDITSRDALTTVTINGTGTIIAPAFAGLTTLTTLTISEGITEIGANAFSGCTNLATVTIPDSVKLVDPTAFEGTAWFNSQVDGVVYAGKVAYTYKGEPVTEITIKDGTHTVLAPVFSTCTGLTTLTIPASVKTIGENAFSGCTGLTTVIFNGTGKIADNILAGLTTLETLTISEGITEIGENAFSGCTGLTTVTISTSVKTLTFAFTNCTNLKTIVFNGTGKIADNILVGCTTLETLTISEGITEIGANAFSGCTGITTLEIPIGLTIIGANAFNGCTGLTTLTIPASVKTIGVDAFSGCTGITTVTLPVNAIDDIKSRDALTTVTINGTGVIPENAFAGLTTLTTLTISKGITEIGANAFNGCTKLTTITIPSSVKVIDVNAFSGCTGITTVTLPSNAIGYIKSTQALTDVTIVGTTSIPADAFKGCITLETVKIDNRITRIGANAFNGCTKLTTLVIPASVTKIGANAFSGCTKLTTVTLPVNAIDDITSRDALTTVIINGTGIIPENAFKDCAALTTLTISEGIIEIGANAFSGCTGLTTVTIPDSVKLVDPTAFDGTAWFNSQADGVVYAGKVAYTYKGEPVTEITIKDGTHTVLAPVFSTCTGFTTLTIPASVKTIDVNAFSGCTELKTVIFNGNGKIEDNILAGLITLTTLTISEGITEIGANAFSGCTNLATVTIPDSVVLVDPTAFEGTAWFNSQVDGVVYAGKVAYTIKGAKESLTDVKIVAGTHTIAANLFKGCTLLETITIPASVTTIGAGAFDGCIALTTVNIPSGVTEIKENTFRNCAKLVAIEIPDSVETIGANAFKDCVELTTVNYLGTKPTTIDATAFAGCVKYNNK